MIKIAMIGAGSVVFVKNLLTDILSLPALQDCTIALHDTDPERLRDHRPESINTWGYAVPFLTCRM